MTLGELCLKVDRVEVLNTQMEIDKEYYSTTELIYTDGDLKTNITAKGYIHITSVKNATYLVFVDLQYNIYLCIYRYVATARYKHIAQKIRMLRETLKKPIDNKHTNNDKHISAEFDKNVIDINTFTCTECNSKDEMIFVRSKSNPEALETKCKNCYAEYTFVPSKYYRLSSKRIIYLKSEKTSSRDIIIKENQKSNDDQLINNNQSPHNESSAKINIIERISNITKDK